MVTVVVYQYQSVMMELLLLNKLLIMMEMEVILDTEDGINCIWRTQLGSDITGEAAGDNFGVLASWW